jgi:hypothetical protein
MTLRTDVRHTDTPAPTDQKNTPTPLAVVSRAARLLWQCEHMFTLGAVLSPLRTLVRLFRVGDISKEFHV